MTRELIIRAAARAELADARDWYDQRRRGLGADLLLSVEAGLSEIKRRPESFPKVYKTIRRALLKRFPYAIYFTLADERIVVIAIFHASRNPRIWRMRT